ncbi:Dystrobrevin-binding protein, putative [Pediculus humanus corporis]|uniref:Dystrobrevin-binding protein, putative n=1 Tax=Pediculus humanus subsp. corporis TaxID=121224 RepID=E0W0B5_PEDHC|nr:Dystrobrevin-binding protein, putative [Pediculus humanus corporis]EEB19071.1 Dystrobrevin-binding protein, putative [Pediculus humanus corporis]
MFYSIRDTIQNLQENITTTLRGLSTEVPKKQVPKKSTNLNYYAGTDLLEKFQSCWCELHEISQDNATKAEVADNYIDVLYKTVMRKSNDINNFSNALSGLPDIIISMNDLCIEKNLIDLEDIIEKREFFSRQLDHRFQLVVNREKRLAVLKKNYHSKLKEHEEKQELLAKECREASEECFKNDMMAFKETNVISTLLEDVILDTEDSKSLEDFLNDESSNEPDLEKIKEESLD